MIAPLDFSARYSVDGYAGIAFYLRGYETREEYEGDYLICDDDECDHAGSDLCWTEGDTSIVTDLDRVRAVMVGDDRVHSVDVDDLSPLDDLAYCAECGQIGCSHDGRERGES